MQVYYELFIRSLRLKNYSQRTIKAYVGCIKRFMKYIDNDLEKYEKLYFENFLLLLYEKSYTPKTVNLYYNAIRSFAKLVLKKNIFVNMERTKGVKRLPCILSKREIQKVIAVLENKKHKLMISLAYSAGLRVSELVKLKVKDIDLKGLSIHIKGSKGQKDRITIFSGKLVNAINLMINDREKNEFLFESERGGKLTTRTAQAIFSQGLKKAGIKKEATFHSLHHGFATHLLENGTDICTTKIYTHIAKHNIQNIISPLDNL